MKTNQELTRWCDEQEIDALNTINNILDTKQYKNEVGRKALTIASNILNSIEEMRSVLADEITK
jgi:hypothetical protein